MIANHNYIFVIRAFGNVVSDPSTIELFTKIKGVDYLAMDKVFDDNMSLLWKAADGATSYKVSCSRVCSNMENIWKLNTFENLEIAIIFETYISNFVYVYFVYRYWWISIVTRLLSQDLFRKIQKVLKKVNIKILKFPEIVNSDGVDFM